MTHQLTLHETYAVPLATSQFCISCRTQFVIYRHTMALYILFNDTCGLCPYCAVGFMDKLSKKLDPWSWEDNLEYIDEDF